MGPFTISFHNKYILLVVDHVSKWVKTMALPTNDGKGVVQFLKRNILTHFSTLRAIITDGRSYFCNIMLWTLLHKYGTKDKVTCPYHLQTNGQVEVSNREIKMILAKKINES